MPWSEESDDVFRKVNEWGNEMNDLKALMERPECCWGYIDELRMALASTCKERDELKKECTLCANKSASAIESMQKELAAMRNELCYLCGKYREAHNGAGDGCRWEKAVLKGGESDA